jgi:hypothetical protein
MPAKRGSTVGAMAGEVVMGRAVYAACAGCAFSAGALPFAPPAPE